MSCLCPQVWPYWAYTYAPDPFQPKPLSDEANYRGELARCPGFEDDPEHYQCVPQPQGWNNCWKCPPKDPFGGGYTAYEGVSVLHRFLQNPMHKMILGNPLPSQRGAATVTVLGLHLTLPYAITLSCRCPKYLQPIGKICRFQSSKKFGMSLI